MRGKVAITTAKMKTNAAIAARRAEVGVWAAGPRFVMRDSLSLGAW